MEKLVTPTKSSHDTNHESIKDGMDNQIDAALSINISDSPFLEPTTHVLKGRPASILLREFAATSEEPDAIVGPPNEIEDHGVDKQILGQVCESFFRISMEVKQSLHVRQHPSHSVRYESRV